MPVPTSPPRAWAPWSVSDLREILGGESEEKAVAERIRMPDRKGLSPVAYAAMKAATTADSLMPLLDLLEPPEKEEPSKVDLILQLLEQIARNQLELGQRLAAMESRLAGSSVLSRSGSTPPGRSVSAA